MKRISILLGMLAITGLSLVSSCVKKEFDAPPDNSSYDPNLTVTTTIAELNAMPQGEMIEDDIVISGIVCMDDRSGNFYKTIVIQDETGGIQILLDQNNLYNDYPVGRKVYVKCKGLFLGNYGQATQLGYTPDATGGISNIPYTLIGDFMVKANYPNTLNPDTVTLNDLASPNAASQYLNKLVVIKNAEFDASQLGVTYAQQASLASATNRTINDCDGGTITLRSSGYAKFQPVVVPGGNGTIVALYTRYNNTPQLYIRDTADVMFSGPRCDGSSPTQEIIFNDGFENLNNWIAYSVTGDQVWMIKTFGNPAPSAVMSGYDGANFANEDWLISKGIALSADYTSINLTFETAAKYSGAGLETYISTNYAGSGDPTGATWTPLSALYDETNNFTFTSSGNIDLSGYKGQTVYIAFKYTSTTGDGKTWEVDNVKVIAE